MRYGVESREASNKGRYVDLRDVRVIHVVIERKAKKRVGRVSVTLCFELRLRTGDSG